jgi:hypothetical protein
MKGMLLAACVLLALVASSYASATPQPFKRAEQACVTRGGFFGVDGGSYYCNFGGNLPPHADKQWYGPTYDKICASYGGTIYEEYPPPYSYNCYIA